jgi:uncharacterized protein YbcI
VTVSVQPTAREGGELAQLCGEVAAIVRRAWGRGPVNTTAHWAGPDALVVLLENGLIPAERTLRAAGDEQAVLAGRRTLQRILEAELDAAVERIFGRKVRAMLSATRLDPDISAEIFLLAPEDEAGLPERSRDARARARDLADEALALAAQGEQIRHRYRH